ncbi:MAG: hypothetical protein U9P10_10375 [Thermodesulfobacteriota bacterium]|nr:hypothetical protein [Thermodesulfobacteriota bacterium]
MNIYFYNIKFFLTIAVTILLLCLTNGNALAHKVSIFAWVEGDTVHTESGFSGGKAAKYALVEVFDSQGRKLLEGKTDEKGEFSFRVPERTAMDIVLQAGMGHRAEWSIPIEELEEEMGDSMEGQTAVQQKCDAQTGCEEKKSIPLSLTSEDFQEVVDTALDKKLKPVLNLLNKSMNPDHGPDISDIFGGIGYILGLMGVAAYFNYRKKE